MAERNEPRFFAYGTSYVLPSHYVRADEHQSYIVDPGDGSVRVEYANDYWEQREKTGAMVETTRDAIAARINRWNDFNSPKLSVPE
jgi:hypothetical protein